jgi:hypothetical protein
MMRTIGISALCVGMTFLSNSAFASRIVVEKTLLGMWYGGSENSVCSKLLDDAQSRYNVLGVVKDCTCSTDGLLQCYWVLNVK